MINTKKLKSYKLQSNDGQVLAEVLIAGGIFALVSGAILGLVLDSYRATVGGEEDTIAAFLSQEGLDAARAIRDNRWTDLTVGNHGVSRSGGSWSFSGTSDTTGKFTRTVIVEDANRSARDGDTVTSGGTNYGRTKKVTSQVTWTIDDIARTVDAVAYLTDWNVFDWVQKTCPDFSAATYTNATTTCTASVPQIILNNAQTWKEAGGFLFTHASSTEFSGGTFSNTSLVGTGIVADVELATSTTWANRTSPTSNNLTSIFMVSASDVWAVGLSGTIIHWDGNNWSAVTSPVIQDLNGVHMVTATDGWIVGGSGKILRWNGASWSQFVDTGNETWQAVFMVSATDGWAVSTGGVIGRWNGTTWDDTITSPTAQNINSVHCVSFSDCWAAASSGKILRWNGTSWSEFVDTGATTWRDIHMISASDGFIVGDAGAIRRWDGAAWNIVTSPVVDDIWTVSLISATDGWAAGTSGKILRWDGVSWTESLDTGTQRWNALHMIGPTQAWIVGEAGKIRFYAATSYAPSGTFLSSVFDSGQANSTWNTLYWSETLGSGTDLTIAVRTGPTPTPDGSWEAFTASEFTNPLGETLNPANNRYFQYRATFTSSDSNYTSELHDITVLYNAFTTQHLFEIGFTSSGNDGWAVGDAGVLLRFQGVAIGLTWATTTSPTAENLKGVSVLSTSDAWAAGASGKILRWNGTSWSEHTDTGNETWRDVNVISSTDGWVVGSGGNIRRWNGTAWNAVTSPTTNDLQGVYMLSATDGWAVGITGTIIRWNGSSWSNFSSPTNRILASVAILDPKNAWAVGNSGTMLRYTDLFYNSGSFISSVLDTVTATNRFFQSIFWSETLQSGTDIMVATRSGNVATPDVSWTAFSEESSIATGTPILAPDARYLQYRVTFVTTDTSTTSQLHDVTLTYK